MIVFSHSIVNGQSSNPNEDEKAEGFFGGGGLRTRGEEGRSRREKGIFFEWLSIFFAATRFPFPKLLRAQSFQPLRLSRQREGREF